MYPKKKDDSTLKVKSIWRGIQVCATYPAPFTGWSSIHVRNLNFVVVNKYQTRVNYMDSVMLPTAYVWSSEKYTWLTLVPMIICPGYRVTLFQV